MKVKLIYDDFGYSCGIIGIASDDKSVKKLMRKYIKGEYEYYKRYIGMPDGRGGVYTNLSIFRKYVNTWKNILKNSIKEIEIDTYFGEEIYWV